MDYKKMILELLEKIDGNDVIFLNQIYTIIKKHVKNQEDQHWSSWYIKTFVKLWSNTKSFLII